MHTARECWHFYQWSWCILSDAHRDTPIDVNLRRVLNESTSKPTSVAGYSGFTEREELIVELLDDVVLCRLSESDKVQGIPDGLRWLLDKVEDKKAERKRERKIWENWEEGGRFVQRWENGAERKVERKVEREVETQEGKR